MNEIRDPSKKIIIFDTTLRDGEQAPGASMTLQDKVRIAKALDKMGVDVIEAGFAASSEGNAKAIAAVAAVVKNATVCSLARSIKDDIFKASEAIKNARHPRIHTFTSTSPTHMEYQNKSPDQILKMIREAVSYAQSLCDDVQWSAMDATRSDKNFLAKAVGTAIKAGATTINLPDTVGYGMPMEHTKIIASLVKRYPGIDFSVHCHDDLGLATANSIMGIMAGARQVEGTINGIGERAGNAALEEVVMALNVRSDYFGGCWTGIDTTKIAKVSKMISRATRMKVAANKAIVGANAFSHESGIHQDGMLKNPYAYEIMKAETVGLGGTNLPLGRLSGKKAFIAKAEQWGIEIPEDNVAGCFDAFKTMCDQSPKKVTEANIRKLMQLHTAKPNELNAA